MRTFPKLLPPWLASLLLWALVAACVSIILGLSDCWVAGTARRDTVFSKTVWATRDGGTRGYLGLGYSLTYYRAMSGEHGPEIWFWFTPFRMYWTTERHGFSWLLHSWPRQPSYKGRTLDDWTDVWYRGYSGESFATREEQADAETAIRAMGTNCIPSLLACLSDEDPDLNQRSSVVSTFQILGELGRPAAPSLFQLATNGPKDLRYHAFLCLEAVKPEKDFFVRALVTLINDPNKHISFLAAEALLKTDSAAAEKVGVLDRFPQFK
jgi:hypothetical protein